MRAEFAPGTLAERAVVAIESIKVVVPLPAETVGNGEKVAVAPGGNGETTASVTGVVVVLLAGVTVKVNEAA